MNGIFLGVGGRRFDICQKLFHLLPIIVLYEFSLICFITTLYLIVYLECLVVYLECTSVPCVHDISIKLLLHIVRYASLHISSTHVFSYTV